MSCCTKTAAPNIAWCYTDAAGVRSSLMGVTVTDCDGQIIAQSFHTPANFAINDLTAGIDVSAGTLTAGACVVPAPDVEWVKNCEEMADGSVNSFMRRSLTKFDANGDVEDPVTVADFELDKITAYVVTDEANVSNCDGCVPDGNQGIVTDVAALFA